MRKALLIVGALTLTVVPATAVYGFGATRFLSQAHEHERMTRAVMTEFQRLTLNQFAGVLGEWGAIAAPDRLFSALAFNELAHCDNGDYLPPNIVPNYPASPSRPRRKLEDCREWIASRMRIALDKAAPLARPNATNTDLDCNFTGPDVANAGSDKCQVLKAMGQSMHAAQDFYAHSNWTDHADPHKPLSVHNPPGLQNTGPAPFIDPRNPAPYPPGLISGCFTGYGEFMRCNYGFLWLKSRMKHSYLNKDLGEILANGTVERRTPRGKVGANFLKAYNAASEDTLNRWEYFKQRAVERYGQVDGEMIICVVTHDDYRTCLEGAGVAPSPGH